MGARASSPQPNLRRLRRAPGRGSLGLNFEACVCMRVAVWSVCLCACVLVVLCVCVFVCLPVCVFVCLCACVLVCLCVYVVMCVCGGLCLCVFVGLWACDVCRVSCPC